ncbi:MAG: type II toxin-antitoxin system VapC family toxin [Magnetococcales bacterium]|nr:type II toxin-antitoxin system VapC family toxin [Magnetococcales bacterium]NGZ27037.1 type II toxin-antitoxin system VapC family toxin [Magnetococcales bacterium]
MHRTFLLDTNILLAALIAPEKLTGEVADWIATPYYSVYFSSASIWEIAIKYSLNRSGFNFSPADIHRLAVQTGFTELPVHAEHCYPLASMPWHHKDPFDRLLLAQARSLPAHLLTSDPLLVQYSDLVISITFLNGSDLPHKNPS